MGDFSTEGIAWVKPSELVRRRPGMYLGATVSTDGLHRLVTLVLDNVVDDAAEGHGTRLTITLARDGGVTFADDGRGIPVEPHRAQQALSILEVVFTTLGACYCGCEAPAGHRRWNRIGEPSLLVVNALSSELEVETIRAGRRYRMAFARGERVSALEDLGPTAAVGTTIRFVPDRSIFPPEAALVRARLLEQLEDTAALLPGFTVTLNEERSAPFSKTIVRPRGLTDLVEDLTEQRVLETAVATRALEGGETVEGEPVEAEVHLAIQAADSGPERLVGFVNFTRCDEGTHIEGLADGLDRGFADAARALEVPAPAGRPRGLRAAVALRLVRPWFDGLQKVRLANPEARALVAGVVRRSLGGWAAARPSEARALLERTRSCGPNKDGHG